MKCLDRVAVVTGGGRGIGQAIALTLAGEGADLAIWDVELEQARRVSDQAGQMDRRSSAYKVDVSDWDQVRAAAAKVLEEFGRIDILVNNAGICNKSSIEDLDPDDWDKVLAVNLKGTFLCSKAVMGAMKRQRWGRVINLGSVAGKVGGIAVAASYSASKAGVMCFTKSLAKELGPYGVTVNALAPGQIDTEMGRMLDGGSYERFLPQIPLGRVGQVEDVAQAALFLASEGAGFITGEIMDINGGLFMD